MSLSRRSRLPLLQLYSLAALSGLGACDAAPVAPVGPPDLVVSLDVPAEVQVGDTLVGSVMVRNAGGSAAEASSLQICLTEYDTFVDCKASLNAQIPSLSGGRDFVHTFSVPVLSRYGDPLAFLTATSRSIDAEVTATSDEADRQNNRTRTSVEFIPNFELTCGATPIEVNQIAVSPGSSKRCSKEGSNSYFDADFWSFSVSQAGQVKLSLDRQGGNSRISVGVVNHRGGVLLRDSYFGDPMPTEIGVQVPAAGTYYVVIRGEGYVFGRTQ